MPGCRSTSEVRKVFDQYQDLGELISVHAHGNGHINDTFLLTCRLDGHARNYILQHINQEVFKDPIAVMSNFEQVTCHIRGQLEAEKVPDIQRRVLRLIPAADGRSYALGAGGQVWRMVNYVQGTTSYDVMDEPRKAFEAGKAFGLFQARLSDLSAESLKETIPFFHHTPRRVESLRQAYAADLMGRAEEVAAEYAYALSRESAAARVVNGIENQTIPVRITHNDTKLNNVLMDNHTHEGVCVIDLDTVMPGSVLYDFGDLVRTATNTGAEDEPEVDLIDVDLELFRPLTEGYLSQAIQFLNSMELELLPFSAELLAYENGVRFLTDYLEGDRYFRIHREQHNLERCRAQFRLAQRFHHHRPAMTDIVQAAVRPH